MTPSGSFQGSNRETWRRIGRAGSTRNLRTTSRASSIAMSWFFTEKGSIVGAWMSTFCFRSGRTNCGIVQMDASCSSTNGRRNDQTG